jgi:hypothetical protein
MTAAIAHRPTATVPPGYPAALTGAVPAMRAAKLKSSDTLSQGAITAPWLSDLASPKRAAADPGVADLCRRETREPYDREPGYYVVRRDRLGAASWASCAGHCKARTNPLAGISAYLNEVEIEGGRQGSVLEPRPPRPASTGTLRARVLMVVVTALRLRAVRGSANPELTTINDQPGGSE